MCYCIQSNLAIHTHTHTYIHTYIHKYIYVYKHNIRIHTYVQELATSTFVQNVVEFNADKSASAIKYKQVLAGGGNGKNWLWQVFFGGGQEV